MAVARFSFYQAQVLVVLTLVSVVHPIDRQIIFPLFSLIKVDFALSRLAIMAATREPAMPEPCRHARTRVIAEDDATTYVECLDCGGLFETAELDRPAPAPSGFEEDLSDA